MKKGSTLAKPRILIVGGEASRNFGSKDLHEAFEIVHVEKGKTSIPRYKDENFAAVVLLPWREKHIAQVVEKWGKARGIPVFQARSTGTIRYYLGEKISWIREYLKSLDEAKKASKSKKEKPEVVSEDPSKSHASPEPAPPQDEASKYWDEDQLWAAYGESFVQSITGLDGETTDRRTFVELVEEETGLKGEPVEVLISIMRRQGVITEHDGGVVSIGAVTEVDVEKRKRFIERQEKKEGKEGKAPEADPEKKISFKAIHMSDEELLRVFYPMNGEVFENTSDLFKKMGENGMSRDGKPFSHTWMRLLLFRAEGLGLKREKAGRFSFILRVPGAPESSQASLSGEAQKEEEPKHLQVVDLPSADAAPVESKDGTLVSKPFEAAFPSEAKKKEEEKEEKPSEALDISHPEVLYEALSKSYPAGRIPELGGLVSAVRAFRCLFYDNQWDVAAARGMLQRLGMKVTEGDVRKALSRKLDFTDDEWSYFAIEHLRDMTLFSLLPLIDFSNRLWKICESCQKHFYFNLPRNCYECKEYDRRVMSDAKGGDIR